MTADGCSYGKVTRNMTQNMAEDFKEFRTEMRNEFHDLKKTNITLYNHLSSRLPPWALALGAVGLAILSAMVGARFF